MLKDYDELARYDSMGVSKERALWNIARELSRKNDLLEVDMLCKTADAIRAAAKGSLSDLHDDGWVIAERLVLLANKKIADICIPHKEGDKNDETEGE